MSQALAAAAARSARAGAAAPGRGATARGPRSTPGTAPRSSPRRPALRVVSAPATAGSPLGFALVCAALLGAGLIALLLLNTALAQGTFTLQKLQTQAQTLADQRQALAQSVSLAASPEQLSTRAWALGLVPATGPAFVHLPSGKIVGVATPAPDATPPTVIPTSTTGTTGTSGTTGSGPSSGTAPGSSPAVRVDPNAPTGVTPPVAPVAPKGTTKTKTTKTTTTKTKGTTKTPAKTTTSPATR